ncbi:Na+/H+ antiporter subunit D [Streptomyces sp. CC77]|uniref:Na+/H+ antiporter subunit D n=1 Tax=Streptomyces sp. CC77 TaxID=1906739 RepID=UPI0008DE5A83|nr:Na+/H+ antiporter subunit D [Streptomyces sp. CC77]OII69704.1 Na+/H+ antiporter subunit D [Streptomyces sp. CC77]
MTALLSLPVLLPLLAAAASLFPVPRTAKRLLSTGTLAVVLADAVVLLVRADAEGPLVLEVGGWPAPLGVVLVADRLSALLLTVSALVALAVLLYAIGQGTAERRGPAAAVLHPAYLLLVAGVALAYLTGDLFNLFVAFETMLASSYVLITLDAGEERARSGMTYTITGLASSLLLLTVVALVYASTGTVNLADLARRTADLPDGTRTVLGLLVLVVFGIKAALVPLHFWLPDSYPTAPAPITAVFAALLTKVAVYALLRVRTLLFPQDGVDTAVAVAAVTTMLVGVVGALAQDDVNRLLSFLLVGHIGFMMFGLALSDPPGLAGTVLYMVHHIVVQAALFLAAGLVVREAGTPALHRMRGARAPSAALSLLFAVPALSLAGTPPFSGFVAKVALLGAGADTGGATAYALAATALLASLLTLYALAKAWAAAFWREQPAEDDEAPGTADAAAAGEPAGGPRREEETAGRGGARMARDEESGHGRGGEVRDAGGAEAREEDTGRGGGAAVQDEGPASGGRRGVLLMTGTAAAMTASAVAVAACAGLLAPLAQRAADDLLRPGPYTAAVLGGEAR